jgi:excinuclease ABC subunit C
MDERIRSAIWKAPKRPGVYLWKDALGKILYVGKAESLRDRLRNYLAPPDEKTARLVAASSTVETVITKTEEEALMLEDALVKQNQPRYNVRLRDDKRYPLIRVTVGEKHPRIEVVRRVELDGSRYFGPYTDSQSVRKVMRVVGDYFGVRRCSHDLSRMRRPCIEHRIGKCAAPCQAMGADEYSRRVAAACSFLGGKQKQLKDELKAQIRRLSARMEYEQAAVLRDMLSAMDSLSRSRQDVSSSRLKDMDVVGYGFAEGRANITQFKVRVHHVVAVLHHPLTGVYADDPSQALKAFIKQHYTSADLIPALVVSSGEPADRPILEAALAKVRGSLVRIQVASRGQKRKLAELAIENSIHQLCQEKLAKEAPDPLEVLRTAFRLGRRPQRIEGYDISNLGAKGTVGGMVVFTDGRPDKGGYRRFRVRGLGQDDPANLAEVVGRRFAHPEWKTPDIVLLDGGRQQLTACRNLIPAGVAVLALAKKDEEIHLSGRREPVRLSRDNPGLLMLEAVRDEVHRFARAYHIKRRAKEFL